MINQSNPPTTKFLRCPYCQGRLWRLGSPKLDFSSEAFSDTQVNLNIPLPRVEFLAADYSSDVEGAFWVEEFFCEEDGSLWFLLSRQSGTDKILSPVMVFRKIASKPPEN